MSMDELEFLRAQGFTNFKHIDGKLCATQDYLTTRAVVVGLGPVSYERRYCYQDRAEADAALTAYDSTDRHPPGPWIKVKGTYRGRGIDAMNPAWPDRQPWDEVAPE